MLDPKKINQLAQTIGPTLKYEIDKKKESEIREKSELRQKHEQLELIRKQGEKVLKACQEFYRWAMKNKIPPQWKQTYRDHWWSLPKKGWDMAKYQSGEVTHYDTFLPKYTHLIVKSGFYFQIEVGDAVEDVNPIPIPVKDISDLSRFSIEDINKSIAKLVYQFGVPFRL